MKQGTELLLKFKLLKRALGLDLWQVKGLLQSLWDFTSQSAPRGDIGRHTDEEIAIGIEYERDATEMIGALVDTGWIDVQSEHRLVIHDWSTHAERSVHTKLARGLLMFADGTQPDLSQLTLKQQEKTQNHYNSGLGTQ